MPQLAAALPGQPGAVPPGIPALRPGAPLAPAAGAGLPGVGPQASAFGVGGGPDSTRVQGDMLKALNKLVDYTKPRPFAGGVAAVGGFGPLAVDGGDFGERRA